MTKRPRKRGKTLEVGTAKRVEKRRPSERPASHARINAVVTIYAVGASISPRRSFKACQNSLGPKTLVLRVRSRLGRVWSQAVNMLPWQRVSP